MPRLLDMGTTRSARALATGLLIALATAGCATTGTDAGAAGTPTVTATVTAEPTAPDTSEATAPDPLATVDRVVVSGSGLSLRRGDVELASLPFAGGDLDEQVAALETVFGSAPREAGVLGDHCVEPQTRWAWGEVYHGTRALHTDEGSLVFLSYDDTVERPDGSVVRIETTTGLAAGDDAAPLRELPGDQKDETFLDVDGRASYLYDRIRTLDVSGPEPGGYGALALVEGGVVDRIAAPTSLYDYC